MHILITGGTGLIGKALILSLDNTHSVIVLTRNMEKAKRLLDGNNISFINSLSQIDINDIDAIVNLAGEPIADKRWSESQKDTICSSRWGLTLQLSNLINGAKNPPKVFISGSAIGVYGRQGSQEISEDFTDYHHEFTHEVCKEWEGNAKLCANSNTKVCLLRTGIVLSNQGGALSKMILPFKVGLGATIGNGQQYMSWIHIDDIVSIIKYALTAPVHGAINATAPFQVTNQQFSQALAKCLNRPCLFSFPTWMMKVLMGEQADLIVYGQRVAPKKLLSNHFNFKYPTIDQALKNIINR